MRTFLLTVFWVTAVGSVMQLLVIGTGGWIVFSGASSFSELSVNVFVTEFVPWLLFLKTLIISLFGELGRWILEIPILVIATLKLVTGTIIGLWANSVVKAMPVEPPAA
jgi:hypothetical protein